MAHSPTGRALRVCLLAAAATTAACDDPTGPDESPGAGWTQVTAGAAHACALNMDGSAWCWGANAWGQLGDGSLEASPVPVRVGGDRLFDDLQAAGEHTCGILRDGTSVCWGRNEIGELGTGSPFPTPVPTPIAGRPYVGIHVGFYSSCGSDPGGGADCWGGSRWIGSLPMNASVECIGYYAALQWPCARTPEAFRSGTTFEQIEVGLFFGCGIATGGVAVCWGMNDFGQLGSPGPDTCESQGAQRECAHSPRPVGAPSPLTRVSAGAIHACGLDADGVAYCWGATQVTTGPLGIGHPGGASEPTPVATQLRFRAIRASKGNSIRSHTCGIAIDGSAWCWGANAEGALGSFSADVCSPGTPNEFSCSFIPSPVTGNLRFSSLTLGMDFTCGLVDNARTVHCWGRNDQNQLGDGTVVPRQEPRPVLLPVR